MLSEGRYRKQNVGNVTPVGFYFTEGFRGVLKFQIYRNRGRIPSSINTAILSRSQSAIHNTADEGCFPPGNRHEPVHAKFWRSDSDSLLGNPDFQAIGTGSTGYTDNMIPFAVVKRA